MLGIDTGKGLASPSFLLPQAIFEPNLFPYKNPNILKPSHSSYLPTPTFSNLVFVF